ncbi:hypothetical protein H5410_047617 [Solanum commersonii]|uniref:Uncharacterized protein n=1 Tax=Solanum commersonii TaxID=4109 RepID=A0A9J5XHU6_SOLCO|nr:hypothetical protein H5410_047617 [Solanum commersonii]
MELDGTKLASCSRGSNSHYIRCLVQKFSTMSTKLNKYNLKEGVENFTISKLWIPDDNLEAQYKLRK